MSLFKKSYPYHPILTSHLWIALGLGIWVFLFLFLVKPLTVDSLSFDEQVLYVPFYGLVAGICYLLAILPQKMFYQKQKQQWFVLNELMVAIGLTVYSTILIWLYFRYVVTLNDSVPWTFGEFLMEIFLPAFVVIIPLVFITRYFIGKYYQQNRKKIRIEGSGNYEHLHLFLDDLIYIQSSNNYVEVYHLINNEIKNTVIRTNLSKVEEAHPELLKIHRSYLINKVHYKAWKVEKGKHFIVLHPDEKLPVSKTNLELVKSTVDFATN
jgi:hypothetical protein